jgi:hypothetical protein
MVDNAPALVAEQAGGVSRNLILLTRPYPPESIGWKGTRLYLCPTEPVPINRWDYTSIERVEDTDANLGALCDPAGQTDAPARLRNSHEV